MNIPLAQPDIGEREIEAVVAALRSSRLSLGSRQKEFEAGLARFVGAQYGCAVSSGTAGLHLALVALGIGSGAEVITSSFSFVASANCALYTGAKPVFADIDPETWNLDPAAVEAAIGPRTRAIIPVHVFGQPCRMDRITAAAENRGLAVVEDSCEALGSALAGRPAGTMGRCGVFAFYPNKQITTGEGGMIVTNDAELDAACRSLRNQGRPEMGAWLEHQRLGYNYRMTEMQAAMGVVQVARAKELIRLRSRVAEWYIERLTGRDGIVLQRIDSDVRMSWFVFVVRLSDDYAPGARDQVIAKLAERGVASSAYFAPIHLQKFYRDEFDYRPGMLPVTERIGARSFALPFFPRMTAGQVDYVCEALGEVLASLPAR